MGKMNRSFAGVRRVLSGLMLLLAVAGCAGTASGPGPVDRGNVATVVDLATGAVLGAAPESLRWDRRRQQLAVEGYPTLTEATVDDYLDQQLAAMEPLLVGISASLVRKNGTLRIGLPAEALFTDAGDIQPPYPRLLGDIVEATAEQDRHLVEVAGHATGSGAASANQRLSENRARTVAQALAEHGLSERRLLVVGYGEDRPPENPEAAGNRVELILVPLIRTEQ